MYKTRPDINPGDATNGAVALCSAIVAQAVLDYQDLHNRGVTSREEKGYVYSEEEIEDFFHSEWCRTLLKIVGNDCTGERILHCLQEWNSKK